MSSNKNADVKLSIDEQKMISEVTYYKNNPSSFVLFWNTIAGIPPVGPPLLYSKIIQKSRGCFLYDTQWEVDLCGAVF